MLRTLEIALEHLATHGVRSALIGATAMAGRGVLRSTNDVDLLVSDGAVLREGFWSGLRDPAITAVVTRGDDADPLLGVVRLRRPGPDRPLDVIVGKYRWQADVIDRAEPHLLGTVRVHLALAPDLILLKLFAGSQQDLLDVRELLAAGDAAQLEAAVERHVQALPADAREAWTAIVTSRR